MTADALVAPKTLQTYVPLAPMTTLGVGGKARFFMTFEGEEELRKALLWAMGNELPWWILGGGSNVVVADDGLPGVVLQPANRTIIVSRYGGRLTAGAGVSWDTVVEIAIVHDLAGIECLSGIPGMCGAAPMQNIGAYGQQLSDVFEHATVLDTETGVASKWSAEDCAFGYRDSAFKRAGPGRYVILDITLELEKGGNPTIHYPDLSARIGSGASLREVREAVLAIRESKGMVLSGADPDSRSAGSFFVNPVVGTDVADRIRETLQRPDMPAWDVDGGVKLSAAWLIAASGMNKGYGDGNVGLSSKHTLAIINRGKATAAEIAAFAGHVASRVHAATGVQLHPEPRFLGLNPPVAAP